MRRALFISTLLFLVSIAGCTVEPDQVQKASGSAATGAAVSTDPNRFYAVLLNNGNVYFGKLESLGTSYPVLREVFYIQSSVNQQTKAVSNTLIKRGKELHGPDQMIINANAIVFVEPVGPESRVAQLIEESKKSGN
jgi:hypothetical protein